MIIDQIRKRTQEGVGVENGREYDLNTRPYTPQYARNKGSSKVDLTNTGDMLENMYVRSTTNSDVRISVRERDYGKLRGAQEGIEVLPRNEKGNPIQGAPKRKVKRPFFGLSDRDKREIVNDAKFKGIFERALKRHINKKK